MFTVMTWNVENLFRPGQGAGEAERERYRDKLGLLAGVIGGLGPDAVQPPLAVHADLDQAGLAQHPQMLGHRRLTAAEARHELAD